MATRLSRNSERSERAQKVGATKGSERSEREITFLKNTKKTMTLLEGRKLMLSLASLALALLKLWRLYGKVWQT